MDRFWDKVMPEPNSGCWLWMGALYFNGYGAFGVNRKTRRAHRIAYEALRGPIPAGLHLDHKCRVRSCVNPDHLEPVTQAENNRRGVEMVWMVNAKKTHCPRGHPYNEENTIIYKSGSRACRECRALYIIEHREERKLYMKEWRATHTRNR